MSDSTSCASCGKSKTGYTCALCEDPLCKNCTQFLAEDAFSFLKEIPAALTHSQYCGACYDAEVLPTFEEYQDTMAQAKQVFVFFKTRKKDVPLLRKAKETEYVKKCPDRDETILRLAFFAVQAGYNALVDVEVNAAKIRNEAYQTSVWSGSGVPAEVNESRLAEHDLQNRRYT